MGDCTLTTNPMKEKEEEQAMMTITTMTTSRMTRAIWGVKNQDNRPDKLSSMAAASSIWTDKGCSLKLSPLSGNNRSAKTFVASSVEIWEDLLLGTLQCNAY